MSQIEPKKADQLTKLGKVSTVTASRTVSGVANVHQSQVNLLREPRIDEEHNAFFRWARAGRFARLLSIKSSQEIDRKILKNQSNEALIAKLSSIDLKLENLKDTPYQAFYNGELTLGRVIVGEQIRRLRMAVAGKENRESVRPSFTKGSSNSVEVTNAQKKTDANLISQAQVNEDKSQ